MVTRKKKSKIEPNQNLDSIEHTYSKELAMLKANGPISVAPISQKLSSKVLLLGVLSLYARVSLPIKLEAVDFQELLNNPVMEFLKLVNSLYPSEEITDGSTYEAKEEEIKKRALVQAINFLVKGDQPPEKKLFNLLDKASEEKGLAAIEYITEQVKKQAAVFGREYIYHPDFPKAFAHIVSNWAPYVVHFKLNDYCNQHSVSIKDDFLYLQGILEESVERGSSNNLSLKKAIQWLGEKIKNAPLDSKLNSPFIWQKKKTDLVELAYSIYSTKAVIGISAASFVKTFCTLFNTDVESPEKILHKIKERSRHKDELRADYVLTLGLALEERLKLNDEKVKNNLRK